jgi:hypothetical protein
LPRNVPEKLHIACWNFSRKADEMRSCIFRSQADLFIGAIQPMVKREPSEKERPMSLQLPVSIERYIQIANSGMPEAVPECFAADAIVRDEGQTYEGVAAIKNWMAVTKKKYGHTMTPLELAEHGGQSVLKARLAGSFPGSPIAVNFNFVLAGGKIRLLAIG